MGAGEQILHAVQGVLAAVVRVEGKVDLLIKHLGANRGATGAGQSSQGGRVADLREIDGERGDPKIGKRPKKWDGEFFEGSRASQCPPDFLEEYAKLLDWKADNPRDGKDQYAKYDRLDAARCRRWAVEIREGRVTNGEPPAARPTPRSAGNPPVDDNPWESSEGGDDGGNW